MKDLQIVFYIIVAIAWVVYNNFQKIKEASAKRDFKKLPDDVIKENWPKQVKLKPLPVKDKRIPETKEIPVREILKKEVIERKSLVRSKRIILANENKKSKNKTNEGGWLQPSKMVQFEEAGFDAESENLLIQEIKNSDFRRAIVLSEILNRPYN